mgnify:CR=1 FL=1
MERFALSRMKEWKENENRKPLIIRGARQVGKTWIMKTFGQQYFEKTAYVNFDNNARMKQVFEGDLDIERLVLSISAETGVSIEAENTLIIFDEVQEVPKALTSLKYFYEDSPEYVVVAAGSLLGVALTKGESFPVGKVDFLDLYPLTFKEFLKTANEKLYNYVEELSEISALPQFITNRLSELYQQYLVIGGMPAVINSFLENKGMEKVKKEQQAILNAYILDFSKHAENKDIPRIIHIWNSIPSQLAKENRKFVYKMVKPGARARDYEDALLWLESAGLIYRVFCTTKPFLPLKAYDDLSAFKVYLSDVGLLRELSGLPPEAIFLGNETYTEFKGAVAENYVLQSLAPQYDILPRYWTSLGKAEVDFIIQSDSDIIPVEVKAQTRLGGKSLSVYDATYHPVCKLRYSLNNLKQDGTLINIPLYLADWTKKIVSFIS